jgi:hypothetical protein
MAARSRSGRDEALPGPAAAMSGDWQGEASGGVAVYALLAQHSARVTGAISWTLAGTGQCVFAVSGTVSGASFRLSARRKSGATAPERCPDDSVFTGEARDQEIAVEDSPWGPFTLRPVDALRALAERCKQLLEARRWPELAGRLGMREVWAFDRALPVGEALDRLAAILGAAEDIHLWVERVLAAETAEAAGHLSLACCLMWGEAGSFADHERELELHLGFQRDGDGAWSIDYLGVTASRAGAAAAPTAAAVARPGPAGERAGPAALRSAPAGRTREAPAPPGGVLFDGGGEPVPPGYVRVLLPALVPEAAWRGTAAPATPAPPAPAPPAARKRGRKPPR